MKATVCNFPTCKLGTCQKIRLLHNSSVWDLSGPIPLNLQKGRSFRADFILSCLSSRVCRPFEEEKGTGDDQRRQRQGDKAKSCLKTGHRYPQIILPKLLQSFSGLLSFLAIALAWKYVLQVLQSFCAFHQVLASTHFWTPSNLYKKDEPSYQN